MDKACGLIRSERAAPPDFRQGKEIGKAGCPTALIEILHGNGYAFHFPLDEGGKDFRFAKIRPRDIPKGNAYMIGLGKSAVTSFSNNGIARVQQVRMEIFGMVGNDMGVALL
jgi:hypothetical protein